MLRNFILYISGIPVQQTLHKYCVDCSTKKNSLFFKKKKMSKLNGDILYLIFKEFQDNKRILQSCLLVNKTWCEMIIPILWKNPWKYLVGKEKLLLNIIVSHLSDDVKNDLMSQGIDFLNNCYQKPLFDYISFCKHLNLDEIQRIINTDINENLKINYYNQSFYQRKYKIYTPLCSW